MPMKDNLLKHLDTNRGSYLSGEEIAQTLCVSRAAVWKAVKALQNDGYQIDAISGKGYCLSDSSDELSVPGIDKHLTAAARSLKLEVHREVNSTNDMLQDKVRRGGTQNYAIVADGQRHGRGRFGRGFYSPSGTGIYMSLLLHMNLPVNEGVRITCAAAVAVCEAIEVVCGKSPQIKWVNDILLDGRKVCGILTESSIGLESGMVEYVVLGIGVNVYTPQEGFPVEINDIAASVLDTHQGDVRNHLAAEILNRFMPYYQELAKASFLEGYRRRSLVVGKNIMVLRQCSGRPATALAIDDVCRLKVRYDDGTEELLLTGEISIKSLSEGTKL